MLWFSPLMEGRKGGKEEEKKGRWRENRGGEKKRDDKEEMSADLKEKGQKSRSERNL